MAGKTPATEEQSEEIQAEYHRILGLFHIFTSDVGAVVTSSRWQGISRLPQRTGRSE